MAAKVAKVRPVVPLRFGQSNKHTVTASKPVAAAVDLSPPPSAAQVGNGTLTSPSGQSADNEDGQVNSKTTASEEVLSEDPGELLNDASLKGEISIVTTAQTDQDTISQPPPLPTFPVNKEVIVGSEFQSRPEQQEVTSPRITNSHRPEPVKELEQPKPKTKIEKVALENQPPSSIPMPPPLGFQPQQALELAHHPQTNHRTQKSMNGVTFGEFNDFQAPLAMQAHYQNGLTSPPPEALIHAPAFIPGHSHHASNSNTPITLTHPQAMFPPPGFDPHPAGFMPSGSEYPPLDGRIHGSFSLDTPITNGNSGSGSRTMSHSSTSHTELTSSMMTEDQFHRGSGRPSQPSQDVGNGRSAKGSMHLPPTIIQVPQRPDPAIENVMIFCDYLLSQFGSADFADFVLEVNRNGKILLSIPVHGVIVARSPTLLKSITALRQQRSNRDREQILELTIEDNIFVEQAFVEVLQYIYGAPLAPNFPNLVNQVPLFSTRNANGDPAQFARQVLTHALSLVSAGIALQLEAVVQQAIEAVVRLIRWDTIQLALGYIMQDGLPTTWKNDGIDSSGRRPSASPSMKGNITGQLLRDVIDYLAVNFPHHFNFDSTVTQLEGSPRLPMIVDAKPSMSSHRLSRIQFGQLPAEQSDFVTWTLSSVLVSLPYEVLTTLFGHPALINRGKAFQLASIVNTVVGDREARRLKVLDSKRVVPHGEGPLWEATQWREQVIDDPQAVCGFSIIRQRVEK